MRYTRKDGRTTEYSFDKMASEFIDVGGWADQMVDLGLILFLPFSCYSGKSVSRSIIGAKVTSTIIIMFARRVSVKGLTKVGGVQDDEW